MVIECAFGRLKAALKKPMDVNMQDLTHAIYACFVLHNFCEDSKETVADHSVLGTIQSGFLINTQQPAKCGLKIILVGVNKNLLASLAGDA